MINKALNSKNILLFVDGLKVKADDIVDIGNDSIRLLTDYNDTTRNNSVEFYIDRDLEFDPEYGDLKTSIINNGSTDRSLAMNSLLEYVPEYIKSGNHLDESISTITNVDSIGEATLSYDKDLCCYITGTDHNVKIVNNGGILECELRDSSLKVLSSYDSIDISTDLRSFSVLKVMYTAQCYAVYSIVENDMINVHLSKINIDLNTLTITANPGVVILSSSIIYTNDTCKVSIINDKYALLVHIDNNIAYIKVVNILTGEIRFMDIYSANQVSSIQYITEGSLTKDVFLKTKDGDNLIRLFYKINLEEV